jgi:hypothetical protein
MQISYNVQIDDMKAFQQYHFRTSPLRWYMQILYLVFIVIISVAVTALIARDSTISPIGTFVSMFLFLFGLLSIFSRKVNKIALSRAYGDDDRHGVLGEHIITLTQEALSEHTTVNDSKSGWRGVHHIAETAEHIFIYTQPGMAHVIPRRCFPNPADAELFLKTARTYHEAAQKE